MLIGRGMIPDVARKAVGMEVVGLERQKEIVCQKKDELTVWEVEDRPRDIRRVKTH